MIRRLWGFLLVLFIAVPAAAQVELAVFGGVQSTSARYTVRENRQPVSSKWGFTAGAALKVPFEGALYFFPSAYFSLKGYRVTLNDPAFPPTEFAVNNNTTLKTLEVAPLFQVDLSRKASHFFVRFGPAVDFAFSGRETFDTIGAGGTRGTVSRDMVFSFGDYGRITGSANFHLGYEMARGFMVFAHYTYGLGSLNNHDYGPRIKHMIIGLSLGWKFGRNPNVIDTRNRE